MSIEIFATNRSKEVKSYNIFFTDQDEVHFREQTELGMMSRHEIYLTSRNRKCFPAAANHTNAREKDSSSSFKEH